MSSTIWITMIRPALFVNCKQTFEQRRNNSVICGINLLYQGRNICFFLCKVDSLIHCNLSFSNRPLCFFTVSKLFLSASLKWSLKTWTILGLYSTSTIQILYALSVIFPSKWCFIKSRTSRFVPKIPLDSSTPSLTAVWYCDSFPSREPPKSLHLPLSRSLLWMSRSLEKSK